MSKNIAIIENPLPFMVENYIKKKALQSEFSSTKVYMISKDELPHKIFLTFASDELCSKFIQKYNKNNFDPKIDYKLSIVLNDKQLNPEIIKSEILKSEEKKNPYIFDFPYENEWSIDYVTNNEKPGLLYINEEAKKKIYKTAKYLIAKMGKNILTGKSILNVSFPVFIFDKRTLHQAFCHEQRLAPYYITRAIYSPDILERLKWITVHLMAFLHLTTTQVKPFNPIIGETFQCRIGNLKLFLEQTVNHPITANFYGIDDDKTYEMFGYQITDASVTPNTCMATRLGLYYIKIIKDNTLYRIRIPDALVRGTTIGDRMFSYENKCLVMDITNKICSFIEVNPPSKEGGGFLGLGKLFKKRENFPDYFCGHIVSSDFVQVDENGSNHTLLKGYQSICKISGEWTNNIKFDDEEYWGINDEPLLTMYHDENMMLPSDGSVRSDLLCFIKGDIDSSQKEKEGLEVRQREDRKLRAKWAKENTGKK
jgi:hypothetical protein